VCVDASTALRAVAADFFFNCWRLEIPSDNCIIHVLRCVQCRAQVMSNPECHVMLEAFSISKNIAAVDILLLKFRVTWSVSLIHCSVVL
jgi:hypothetical protein